MPCFNYINSFNYSISFCKNLQNMSCFNYIISINYSILFCEGYRICLVSTTLTPSTTEFHVVKVNYINYIDSLNYKISFMSCFNYINSINCIFSFYKDSRICLISTTSTLSTTQFHFMRLREYVLFSTTLTPSTT